VERRIRLAAACVALLVAAASRGVAADAAPAAWKLGLNDFARYDKRRVTTKDGAESVGEPAVATVHGHDLRDEGLYLPVGPGRDDLPSLLAFRTPPAGASEWKLHLDDSVELHLRQTVAVASQTAEALELKVDVSFASAGKPAEFDQFVLRDGSAHATVSFDRAAGVVRSARVAVTYTRERAEPKKTDKPAAVAETWDFALHGVSACGYAAFGADVNAAIDRGVKHLRTLQRPDGAYDPYSGQEMGTTALCVYTLLSCGVAAEDPAVEKALDLICASDLTRTYEQAVGLMAVDRAYTPPDEAARRADDGRRPVRNLPPQRRAWCERTAAALESGCSAPGTWGYPNAGNDLNRADTSNTQYAVLGLQAAGRIGCATKDATWAGVVRHFSQVREAEGPRGSVTLLRAGQAVTENVATTPVAKVAGFRYRANEKRTWGSMTCAAIASLAIVRDEMRRARGGKLGAKEEGEIDAMVAGAWAWLDQHWDVDRHPEKPGRDWYYYWLYALERAAVLDGVQRVGGRDWYFGGATELLARQTKDGFWDEPGGNHTTETCFALLFLKRATAPLTPR
jgi:hypothetical protein